MEANSHIKILNTILMYDTAVEEEKRFLMSVEDFRKAVADGKIKIYDALKIEQTWFGKGDKYTARIRKTTNGFENESLSKIGEEKYEHTVKHHIQKGVDYEITTDLTEKDYELLQNLYKDEKKQIKLRLYVKNSDGSNEDYVITVDIPYDQPDICWVEFELKDAKIGKNKEINKFIKPDWVKVKKV